VVTVNGPRRRRPRALDAQHALHAVAHHLFACRRVQDRELDAFIDGAITEGKVLPKQKPALLAMAKSMSGVVKFADKDQSPLDVLKSFISDAPVKVDFSEKGSSRADQGGKSASLEIDRRAKAAVAAAGGETKLSYQAAVNKVLAEDNTLKLAYFSEV
jgi:hypothetical protein